MVRLCSRIFFLLFVSLFISTYTYSQCKDMHKDDQKHDHSQTDDLNGTEVGEGTLFGAALNQDLEIITFEQLISGSDEFNKMEIVVTGNISDVCQSTGCWVLLSDGNNSVRVKRVMTFLCQRIVQAGMQKCRVYLK